jgi:carboxypeptidase PM20D1
MRIGFLECEYFGKTGTTDPGPGDYTDLFRGFLSSAPVSPGLKLVPVDVYGGHFPRSVHDFDGYIVSGSFTGVDDDLPWIAELVSFLREAHRRHIPLAGICSGHQVLTHALGGAVFTIEGHPEYSADSTRALIETTAERFSDQTIVRALASIADEGDAKETKESIESDRARIAHWITRFFLETRGPEIERLSQAIRFTTVAGETESFSRFEAFLEESFPLVHRRIQREQIGEPGLLFTWQGADPGLEPILFLAHYDVVPAFDEPAGSWTYPPFSGAIAQGFVWGRGTLDDKGSLMALLEAAERLLQEGWEPRRTILLAFGGDEESAGLRGATHIAEHLREREVMTAATIDEGSIVAGGMLRFLDRPVALIGIAEKGYLDVRISAAQEGGHAAMPGRVTALGRVATAVARIIARPFPAKLTLPVIFFLRAIGADVSGTVGWLLRHPRIAGPILRRVLAASPVTEALIRTTQAPTTARGSSAANVLPDQAEITINLRVLPGESCAATLERLRRLVRGTGVTVEAVPGSSDPVPSAAVETPVYRMLEDTTKRLFPDAAIAPFLVTATTDSRRYRAVSRAIYRFVPFELDRNDLAGIHGRNERISLSAYRRAIAWYHTILVATGGFTSE